jgi:pyruvate/2-oxoglutarate dehydrogenase complex dihydrolipoamide dehydrogenase (E3) component
MPSKTELWSARVAHLARHGQPLGVTTGGVTIDMATVLRHKREMVRHEVELHRQNFTATGTELIVGDGRFVGPKTLEVNLDSGMRVLTGDQVFLNLGTQPALPGIPGLKDAGL